jgi:hypothetical protein
VTDTTVVLRAELKVVGQTARKAYLTFMTTIKLLNRPGLSKTEAAKAETMHGDALETLTTALTRMNNTSSQLFPTTEKGPERAPAPRYSSDARRDHSP